MKLFILSHSWYDEYHPIHFTGPDSVTKDDFAALCKRLLPQAAKLATMDPAMTEKVIYYDDIVNSLASILPSEFVRLTPTEYTVNGGDVAASIGDANATYKLLKRSGPLVRRHNVKVEKRWDAYHAAEDAKRSSNAE